MESFHLVLIGFGEVHIQKYINTLSDAYNNGQIESYSIIDLKSAKCDVENRIGRAILKPSHTYYLDDPINDEWADESAIDSILNILKSKGHKVRAFISTEVKAHEAYLKYCIINQIDTLVEKPVIAPIHNGRFSPTSINQRMDDLISLAAAKTGEHSVMCFSRYHSFYNEYILKLIKKKVLELNAPITSFHLATSSGVWNLHREYEIREDHPYKYGYGMIMHGAYHYIDLATQFLSLNKLLFPNDKLSITLSSFAAFPHDQNIRIPSSYSRKFDDFDPDWNKRSLNINKYGETDVTTTFCLKNENKGMVITVGTLSFEQTTPSIRAWKDLPKELYNKNGRVASTDLEIQLSTLFSLHSRAFKIPKTIDGKVVDVKNRGEVWTRSNGAVLQVNKFNTHKVFDHFTNTESNLKLLRAWIAKHENKSLLNSHISTMKMVQALCESINNPGHPIKFYLEL